jgi:hypothetical protein
LLRSTALSSASGKEGYFFSFFFFLFPSLWLAIERVEQHSAFGVSRCGAWQSAELTHPSLLRSTALSPASGKEGYSFSPSLWLAIERVEQRSAFGVSQYGA